MKDLMLNLYREADPAGRASLRKKCGDNYPDLVKAFDEEDEKPEEGDEPEPEDDEKDDEDMEKSEPAPDAPFSADELAVFIKSMEDMSAPEADPAQVDLFDGVTVPEDIAEVDPDAGKPQDAAPILKSINDYLADVVDTSGKVRKGTVAVATRLDGLSKSLVKSLGEHMAEASKATTAATEARAAADAAKAEVAAVKAEAADLRKSVDALTGLLRTRYGLPEKPRGVTTTAAQVIPDPADAVAVEERPADQWARFQKSMNAAIRDQDDARKAHLTKFASAAASRGLTAAECAKLGI